MFKNVPHAQNEIWQNKAIGLQVKYLLNINSFESIWSSFLLITLIKNAICLYMVILENPIKLLSCR